jgi:hypothetical protein
MYFWNRDDGPLAVPVHIKKFIVRQTAEYKIRSLN